MPCRFVGGQVWNSKTKTFQAPSAILLAMADIFPIKVTFFASAVALERNPEVGQAGRTSGLREFIEYALDKGKVWFTRRIDIARWWLGHHNEFSR